MKTETVNRQEMRKQTANIEGKNVTVYICSREDAPIVYSNDFNDCAEAVLAACRTIGCPEFHLVSITGIRWDEELSPWANDPIVARDDHFTGEADSYLTVLEEKIVPYVQSLLPVAACSILHGYSMGGLFALYAAHHSEQFAAYTAPSASVWYPGFLEYAEKQTFTKEPACIYLSIGDKESRTKNPYLSKTESIMEQLRAVYNRKNILSIFEKNPGNHYKDVPLRIAKGLKWTLSKLNEKGE
ncbi:MAG: alpha/beta hydrolase-fold protein [Eubacteriales bacterium]|nr:alpha/beta hydrolase-fold protein [Eubacteriales bacterium]